MDQNNNQQQNWGQQPMYQQPYMPPMNTAPLTVGQYIGMFLLLMIPIANIILLFVWAFGGDINLNKKNYARASLILGLIVSVLYILIMILVFALGASLYNSGTF